MPQRLYERLPSLQSHPLKFTSIMNDGVVRFFLIVASRKIDRTRHSSRLSGWTLAFTRNLLAVNSTGNVNGKARSRWFWEKPKRKLRRPPWGSFPFPSGVQFNILSREEGFSMGAMGAKTLAQELHLTEGEVHWREQSQDICIRMTMGIESGSISERVKRLNNWEDQLNIIKLWEYWIISCITNSIPIIAISFQFQFH